jgi:hypothetical protein
VRAFFKLRTQVHVLFTAANHNFIGDGRQGAGARLGRAGVSLGYDELILVRYPLKSHWLANGFTAHQTHSLATGDAFPAEDVTAVTEIKVDALVG